MLQLSKYFDASTTTMKIVGVLATSALSSYYLYRKIRSYTYLQGQKRQRPSRLIVITGCDSGLGFAMTQWAAKLGYKVLAGCLNDNGEGAQKLRNQFPDQVFVTGLNVTDLRSLENFHSQCRQILETHEGKLRLWAIISNAAICMLGEYFWQTHLQREQQMDVNFWGTVNFITEFRTLLFENKARVLVTSSDCADYPLPFLAAYCASKSAVHGWTQSLRFRSCKVWRDFAMSSGLFANFGPQYKQMVEEMSDADKAFYGEYFENFMSKKVEIFGSKNRKDVGVVDSPPHRSAFLFLLENDISNISVYRDPSFIQRVLHVLFQTLPQRYVDKMANFLLNHDASLRWQEPTRQSS
ncbi:Estradiol 17-beta-dehydrogenase 2 [Orchesella cincta]|uniref:Estradiol 17-beta-dehydrogenase 2 n=1 Tax=Orchesella cincta TaxID=48709 RepID=A0A1D2NFM5_ORCCI|nr:Estradiol 17-beta-dehydrogenase 2 [Orchesella cincta]